MRFIRSKKAMVAAGLAAGLLVSGGVAFAVWNTTAVGRAATTASSNVTSTVTAKVSPAADANLWPGGPSAAVSFTIDNPNPYNLTFTSYILTDIQVTPVSGTCVAGTDVVFDQPTGSLSLPVLAGATNTVGSIANAVKIAHLAGNQDGCQGAAISVHVALTGAQN
jgi:hypothetical protein